MKRLNSKRIAIELKLRRAKGSAQCKPEPVALSRDGKEIPVPDVMKSLKDELSKLEAEKWGDLNEPSRAPMFEDDERAHGGNERPVRFF